MTEQWRIFLWSHVLYGTADATTSFTYNRAGWFSSSSYLWVLLNYSVNFEIQMRYRGVTGRKKNCVRRFLKEPFFVNKINQSINHAGETQMPISHLPHSSLSYSESLGPSSLSLTSRATRLARILATSLSPITHSGHIVFPVTLTSIFLFTHDQCYGAWAARSRTFIWLEQNLSIFPFLQPLSLIKSMSPKSEPTGFHTSATLLLPFVLYWIFLQR